MLSSRFLLPRPLGRALSKSRIARPPALSQGIVSNSGTHLVQGTTSTVLHRCYSDAGNSGSSRDSQEKENAKEEPRPDTLGLVMTYGALFTTTCLVVERLYYGSPANRSEDIQRGYGSPEDFQQAIEALKQDLSHLEGGVSTDPEDLHAHGFSVNDYHPGTLVEIGCISTVFLTSVDEQGPHTQWSYTHSLRRMS